MSDDIRRAKKRVVVTGGTGYIGYALLCEIREKHLEAITPIALARATSNIVRLERLLDYPTTDPAVVVGNLGHIESLLPCVKNADVVVHLAAEMDFFPKDVSKVIQSNVEGTRNLLEACARESKASGSKIRFVYVSSTEAIGPTDGGTKVDEEASKNPTSDYGRSKVLAESVVAEYSKTLDTVIVRPTGVYGPGERFFFYEFMQLVATGLTIVAPSPMDGRVVFTHIDDVVNGILTCVTHADAGGNVYNLCADDAVTYFDIVQTCADILKYPKPAIFLKAPVGAVLIRLLAPIMNIGKKRIFVYHPKTVWESTQDRIYSNERLCRLGFRPKYSVLAGVEQTLRYELATGGIERASVPLALKKCMHIVSLFTFTLSRIVLGRRRLVEDS